LTGLEDCRAKIRETDKRILAVIKERLDAGAQVAEIKRDRSLPTIDSDAEQATMSNLIQLAGDLGVEKKFAERLGELLIEETVRVEETTQPAPSKDLLMKEMFELTQKLTSEGRKVTRFEIGEPNFPAPKEVLQGLDSTFRKKKVVGY